MLSQSQENNTESHYKEVVIYRINSLIRSMNAEPCGDSIYWVQELEHIRDIAESRWKANA
ncbi:MAG: hypothetical protein K0R66_1726 [Gammaproteobacteria bacterium]|jgi:hypothetical protein|nr:hypothetical protein [Gammaproteobacteria bacterium]